MGEGAPLPKAAKLQKVGGLLEKTGTLCFPEIQKPEFKALEVSTSAGKTCLKWCSPWRSQAEQNSLGSVACVCMSEVPLLCWCQQVWWQHSFFFPCLSLIQNGLAESPWQPSLCWAPAPWAGWVLQPLFIALGWRRRRPPKSAGRSPKPGWEPGCWLQIPHWLLAFTSPFV